MSGSEASKIAWIVEIDGFSPLVIRARSLSQARYRCAYMFSDAGYGTVWDGLRRVVHGRRAAHEDEAHAALWERHPRGWAWRACP